MSDHAASRTTLVGLTTLHSEVSLQDIPHNLKSRIAIREAPHAGKSFSNAAPLPKSTNNEPFLTDADRIVIANLVQYPASSGTVQDAEALDLLTQLNNPGNPTFRQPFITSSDEPEKRLPDIVNRYILEPYIVWARSIVRRREDVVFITHMLLHVATLIPSAVYLYYNFTWLHGILHLLMVGYYCGAFSILHHNHIHLNGFMLPKYALFDHGYLYLAGPLMGHTWNSFYYHHVKHHHVENNGPQDLSSTIMFQRDELADFLIYFGRFLFLIWIDLPMYFLRTRRPMYAFKYAFWEIACTATMLLISYFHFKASLFVFLLPYFVMRLGLMVGNWAQHAFVDEDDPDSDFRSSITLIDEASNRHCFNDGYHTAHHLNSLRHWRDHPISFMRDKSRYVNEGALVFRDVGYLDITFYLLRKNYDHLANCLVLIGDQTKMTHAEVKTFLRRKARKFTEKEIETKFRIRATAKYKTT